MVRLRHIAFIATLLIGCDLIAPFDLRDEASVDVDTDADADGDADSDADSDVDGDVDGDADVDSVSDADVEHDVDSEIDQEEEPTPCSPPLTGNILGRFTYDVDFDDVDGRHTARRQNAGGCITRTPGRSVECGRALHFASSCEAAWVEIEDSEDWNDVSAVDFWLRPGASAPAGYVSRDALGFGTGHFAIFRGEEDRIAVRVQLASDETQTTICSNERIDDDEWIHIGVNVGAGGIELWIDGVAQSGRGDLTLRSEDPVWILTCNDNAELELDLGELDLPWVLGASPYGCEPPCLASELEAFVVDGAIDELRFAEQRQDFGSFFE